MYDHYVDCESCEELNYFIKQETEKSEAKINEKEDIIAKMAKEIDALKKKNDDIAKIVESKDKKALTVIKENKELNEKIKALTTENRSLKFS